MPKNAPIAFPIVLLMNLCLSCLTQNGGINTIESSPASKPNNPTEPSGRPTDGPLVPPNLSRPTDTPVVPIGYIRHPEFISVNRPLPDRLEIIALPKTVDAVHGPTRELCIGAWNVAPAEIQKLRDSTNTVERINGTLLGEFSPNNNGSFNITLGFGENEKLLLINSCERKFPDLVAIPKAEDFTTAVYTNVTQAIIPTPKSVFSPFAIPQTALTFATWNRNDRDSKILVMGSGDTIAYESGSAGGNDVIRSTIPIDPKDGKGYFEVTIEQIGWHQNDGFGVCTPKLGTGSYVGNGPGCGLKRDGVVLCNKANVYNSTAWSSGDTIGVAVDKSTNKTFFSHNGVWLNKANPSLGTGGFDMGPNSSSQQYFICASLSGGAKYNLNAGQSPFIYPIPPGYPNGVFQ